MPDSHCRAVFLCGIPYSPPNDPRVILKKHYLSSIVQEKSLTADEWYRLEALKAVNQAIGRVIRHKDDFGIVVMADTRFCSIPKLHLSAWLRPGMTTYEDSAKFFQGCHKFFTDRGLQLKMSIEKLSKEVPRSTELKKKIVLDNKNTSTWITKKKILHQ